MKAKIGKYPRKSERKISVEIERFDTWSLDHTLAIIILPALIQLKHTKHGIPSEFCDDHAADYQTQQSFDFMRDDEDKVIVKGEEKWNEVLDKMIWSFQQLALEDYDNKYHHGKMEIDWIKTNKTYPNPVTGVIEPAYEMKDKDPKSHWYDRVGHELHEQRIQEGLELFGKYYRSLWD